MRLLPALVCPVRPSRPASRVSSTRRRRMRGQAIVEFAICAPIVFAVLFGVVNGGLLMYVKNTVSRASNVGAVTMAAEGVAESTDQDTLAAMRRAGIRA